MKDSEQVLQFAGPPFYVVVLALPAALALVSAEAFLLVYVFAALCGLILLLSRRFERVAFLLFLLVVWFPEFSQTDWDVWSAADFQSLYNYRPITWITASVFDYVFALVVVVWLITIVLPKRCTVVALPLGKEMLWFLGVSTFSLLFGLAKGFEPYYALREFRVSAYFVLTFFIWVTTVDEEAKQRTFIRLLLGAAFVVGTYGIVRYALGIGKEYYGTLLVYYDIADSMVLYLGLFLAASAWFVFKKNLLGIAVLSVPVIFSLVLSYRRGAWIACVMGFLILVLFQHPARKNKTGRTPRWAIPLLVSLLIVVVLSAANESSLFTDRAKSILDTSEDPSNVFRIMDALNALITFARHPIFGVGFGGRYDLEYYSVAVAPEQFWDSVDRASHNGFLFILYKMGTVGFLIYLRVFWKFAKFWLQARRDLPSGGQAQVLLYGCGVGAMAILVNNMTSPVTDSLRPALLLAVVMGCVVSLVPVGRNTRRLVETL